MTISDSAVSSLPWGDRVAEDIDYCIQEWQSALTDAILSVSGPDDDASSAYWFITFIGNILWGATVFFPPAAGAAAGVSAATKAVTTVSALAASGVAQKIGVRETPSLSSFEGKQFLKQTVAGQAKVFRKFYHDERWPWVRKDLVNHMLSMFAINYDKPSITNDDPLNDTNFIKYFNGNDNFQGPEERKKTVWEQFVFQDFRLTFDSGRGGLQDYLTRQFQAATDEFDRQWKRYLKERADKAPTPAQWRFGGYSPNYSEFVFNPGYLGLPPQITCAYHLHVKSPIVSAACQP